MAWESLYEATGRGGPLELIHILKPLHESVHKKQGV